jgi:hypothetical protein
LGLFAFRQLTIRLLVALKGGGIRVFVLHSEKMREGFLHG